MCAADWGERSMASNVRLRGFVGAVVTGVVVLAAAPAYGASAGFSGNACSLLTAKQVSGVNVKAKSCTAGTPVKTSQFTATSGYWGSKTIGQPRVTITIYKLANTAYVAALEAAHGQGQSAGIGSWSRSTGLANGKTADSVIFFKDGYFVIVNVNTGVKKPLKNATPMTKLAKSVANGV
jgi:hypothetical protein